MMITTGLILILIYNNGNTALMTGNDEHDIVHFHNN